MTIPWYHLRGYRFDVESKLVHNECFELGICLTVVTNRTGKFRKRPQLQA